MKNIMEILVYAHLLNCKWNSFKLAWILDFSVISSVFIFNMLLRIFQSPSSSNYCAARAFPRLELIIVVSPFLVFFPQCFSHKNKSSRKKIHHISNYVFVQLTKSSVIKSTKIHVHTCWTVRKAKSQRRLVEWWIPL